ncbi:MAG: YbaK/EbsC family protein [Halobacteriales archaeon]|nr:YbaK/EbsC family protein [Halobacteriales archaeon]
MHPRAEEFAAAAAERYGFEVDVHEFPEGTKTAEDAAAAIGCDVAQIASSLVFVADGEPVVVVTSGANRVSEDRLGAALDADEVRMAEPEEARAATGWAIGGVPPFCHESELRVLVDETLLEHEEVWAAAGTPEGVFPIAPDRLVAIADGEPAAVAS